MSRRIWKTDMNKAMFVGFMKQLNVEIEKRSYVSVCLKRGLTIDRFDNWQSWFEYGSEDTGFRTIVFNPNHLQAKTKYRINDFLKEWGFTSEKVEE